MEKGYSKNGYYTHGLRIITGLVIITVVANVFLYSVLTRNVRQMDDRLFPSEGDNVQKRLQYFH